MSRELAHVASVASALALTVGYQPPALAQRVELTNPYESVDWSSFSHHRADLHVHTIQSDGCHHVEEVVRVFRDAGFGILSITDHDAMYPHASCPPRAAASSEEIAAGFFIETASPAPEPQPANFPANATWPWSDYGAPSPAEARMVGIEGSELTCGHHINSFFNDYGVRPPCADAPPINEWLHEIARRDGLAVINHPEPRFNEWYRELYRYHSAEHLVGMELPRGTDGVRALWDQLLGELMPARPVWGFATSDMHFLFQTQFGFTVFLLDELTAEGVRAAMETGQFYSVVGPKVVNLSRNRRPDVASRAEYAGTYPELRSIVVNRETEHVSIDARGYDEIVWISKPESGRMSIDPQRGVSWPAGRVVQTGPVFAYSETDADLPYVRAELIRHTDDGPIRVLLNPFGLRSR